MKTNRERRQLCRKDGAGAFSQVKEHLSGAFLWKLMLTENTGPGRRIRRCPDKKTEG